MTYDHVELVRRGPVMLIGLNRPDKANAFNLQMFQELSSAYAEFDADESTRVGVLHGIGRHFTAGMDLPEVAPVVALGHSITAADGIHPWQIEGRRLSKPLVAAVHGQCLTLGVELILAADIVVCTASAGFATLEPQVGLFPFGGGTVRLPQRAGYGNAMRWLLTSDRYGADEAYRLGLVQEVVADGEELERAIQLAEKIARQAPLAVRAMLENARLGLREGEAAAELEMPRLARETFTSEDGRTGVRTFREPGRPPAFVGR